MILFVALLTGFVCGVLVNLLADYLPARRHYQLMRSDPFASRDLMKPPLFGPRRTDGRLWPVTLWSGLIAELARQPVFDRRRRIRRLTVEIGMALLFAAITSFYADNRSLPFLLFYAAVFVLITATDIEHRWILPITIWPPALVALAESVLWPRVAFDLALRGGIYGFGIMFVLYILGMVFARGVAAFTGRHVGKTVLGFGDVRMGMLTGLIVGWHALAPALLIMVLSGATGAIVFIVSRMLQKKRYRMFSAIPYGPYIVLGAAVMLYVPWMPTNVLLWIAGYS